MPSKDLLLVTWFCVVLFWMNKITWKRLGKNGIVNEIQMSWRGQNCRLMLLLQIYFFNRLQQGLQIVNRGEGEEWTSQCIQLVWHRFLCFKRFFSFFFFIFFFVPIQFSISSQLDARLRGEGGWRRVKPGTETTTLIRFINYFFFEISIIGGRETQLLLHRFAAMANAYNPFVVVVVAAAAAVSISSL